VSLEDSAAPLVSSSRVLPPSAATFRSIFSAKKGQFDYLFSEIPTTNSEESVAGVCEELSVL
jgi:hypothetical protein